MQTTAKQPRKLAHAVVERLSGRIRRGDFKPGDKLPTESEITRAFGVSRTVVREAMSRLQAAELVETRHGIGTFVREGAESAPFRIDPVGTATLNELIAILELRISIEAEAAALAADDRDELVGLRGLERGGQQQAGVRGAGVADRIREVVAQRLFSHTGAGGHALDRATVRSRDDQPVE